ncbi:uncharacterized protein A4U43_C03F21390 [Asparagus officinalis]|uniref:Uncharacterized protein n=1 Tax=Asparagus officinalis TaxID=4686 RepID=A0A5P1FBW1_ASPOF|nr:homeobox protein HOX1A-like [Asparagus officinalis]XP_020257694.1 homeobox protein HOX1A-like [Asparagus officinalis]XP_020257695.1 homeobox protein HOX1A-like [Asparagus officinalis]ONK75868.1 uncharacterized protein A4U43_C03F21390 [Asparagus officinalis]
MASPISSSSEIRSISRQSPRLQVHEPRSGITENGCTKSRFAGPENVSILAEQDETDLSKLGKVDVNNDVVKSPNKSPRKRKKVSSQLNGKRYPLRSSLGTGRVLRSMSNTTNNTQPGQGNAPVNTVKKGRKKRKGVKGASNDEFSVIRRRVRYLLTRMNYEQNLIDAYAGEGWKGQSAEKLKPEKELERAKSEILRCKFKIRELFRHLVSLSSEGKFEESLFDSEGQIDSEDIFCAKCASKDVSLDNDIILCDGICDRGFHQKCLNPPLLSEDIPLGDEGWLCPACDCKVDCIELLNEFQGSNISIKDTWEKVFPEAVAITNGDKQHDDMPSDDSEDYDYDPDGLEADVNDHKGESGPGESESEESESGESESEGSDFSAASEDSDAPNSNKKNENFGLPSSDDSEDDDFDPDAPDASKNISKDSSSDESDFTSDSDEFCNELSKNLGINEDSATSLSNLKPLAQSGEGTYSGNMDSSELLSPSEPVLGQENEVPSGKRQLERLDYKKLYDEAYGKSSDSSSDEEWSDSSNMNTSNNRTKYASRKESDGLLKMNMRTSKNCKKSNNVAGMSAEAVAIKKSGVETPQVSQGHETTPRKTHQALDTLEHEVAEQKHGRHSDSNANKSSASSNRRLGEVATQKLYECFQENQYPTRQKKESLSEELGLTYRQVDKWFTNSRHSFRVSSKDAPPNGEASLPDKDSTAISRNISDITKTDESTGQTSTSEGVKRKKSEEAKQIKVGAEHVNEGNTTFIGQSSRSKGFKRKNSEEAKQIKVGAERGKEHEGNMSEADKDRQKAIARELRKMKQKR